MLIKEPDSVHPTEFDSTGATRSAHFTRPARTADGIGVRRELLAIEFARQRDAPIQEDRSPEVGRNLFAHR